MTPPADLPAAGTEPGDAPGGERSADPQPVQRVDDPAPARPLDRHVAPELSDAAAHPADRSPLVPAAGLAALVAVPLAGVTPARATPRKRPKPGERRVQILKTLGSMLERPGAERITTAALAARLGVSEAALYRHFASKTQMFEALVEFIEQSVVAAIEPIAHAEPEPSRQVLGVLTALLQFAETNPGMARVMVGDALVLESERLVVRMSEFFDRIEATLRKSLAAGLEAAGAPSEVGDAEIRASVLTAFAIGRLQRFARSGFARSPTEHLETALHLFVG